MTDDNKTNLIKSLHEIGAIQLGEFKLKSGQTSKIYINLRKIISYPAVLVTVADTLWEPLKNWSFDVICGVPYTALPIATAIALKHHIPMVMRRKEKKDYGTKKMIEGDFQPNQTCVILEDVVTTGGSILETASDLENAGLNIAGIVSLIDREQGGNLTLSAKYDYQSVLKMSDILTLLAQDKHLNAEEQSIVKELIAARSHT